MLALLLALGCGPRPATTDTASPSAEPTAAEPTAAPSDPDDPLASLAWLAGTWVSADPEGPRTPKASDPEAAAKEGPRTVEHWLAPEGGTMLGVNRTTEGARTVFFEYLRIEADAQGIAYLASPRGRHPPTRFGAVDSGPGFVVFENLEHDFPQRIEYRRDGERLDMRISGVTADGRPEGSAWSMRRVGD